ncbi:peptidase S41 [Rickettsiales bacterium]|nr:peptidase S41 [Rickettsiales bacterium]
MYKIFLFVALFVNCSLAAHRDESSRLLSDVFDRIHSYYVNEVTQEQLLESAIDGMLTDLDPHSGYLNADALNEMYNYARGEFGGIGIEVTMEHGLIRVIAPIDDTPAFHAGIKAGDYISHIEGQPVNGMNFFDSVGKMRGEAGTELNISVLRVGEAEPLAFKVIRDIIKVRSVRHRMETDGIAYIRLSAFNEKTTDELRDAVLALRSGSEVKGILLDLRNNPGGLLDQAVEVVRLFLKQGEIVTTKGRTKNSIKRYDANGQDITSGTPMAVLINGGSASASEIVAGALQDNHRAIILGTRSFGKGSVQTVMPLSDNKGAIRLTTALYYTASGRSIQAEGIIPDIELCNVVVDQIECNQSYGEASLPNHIELQPVPELADKNSQDAQDTRDNPQISRDYQLSMAARILQGIILYGDKVLQ